MARTVPDSTPERAASAEAGRRRFRLEFAGSTLALGGGALLLLGCDLSSAGAAPDASPPAYGRPAAASQPGDTSPKGDLPFVESAEASGINFRMRFLPGEQGENFKINLYDHGCGTCVADIDADGDDDILFLNQLGPNALYRNDGVRNGRPVFTDIAAEAGVALTDKISVSACFADVDDDGDDDLYVTTTRGGNVMFRNDGASGGIVRFTDVTDAAGLTLIAHSETPIFFDSDGDGDLDLLVTNTARWTTDTQGPEGRYFAGLARLSELVAAPVEPNCFYRNEGGWRFTECARAVGLTGPGWGGDVAAWDYDGDGDTDLFVGNMFGGSALYRNDGGRFSDVTAKAFGRVPWGTVGLKVFDHDGDGRRDLYVLDMHSDMWLPTSGLPGDVEERRRYGGPEGPSVEMGLMSLDQRDALRAELRVDVSKYLFGNALFRSLGDGRFDERSGPAGLETFWPWGAATADFDLDGDDDVFVPTGMGYPFTYWRAPYLVNDGKGVFSEGSRAAGLTPPGGDFLATKIGGKNAPRSSRSAAVGDFDADGRPDLVVNNFNDRPYLWLNRNPARSWVGVRLHGTKTHRSAIGAVATVRSGGRTLVRAVETSNGYLAQSSRTLLFGLGDASGPAEVEVAWPGGAKTKVPLATGRVHDVLEK